MVFTPVHIFEQAALIQGFAPAARTAGHLPLIFLQLIKGDATNSGRHAGKGDLDQFSVESYRFEQLCTAIGVHRGDAHLGHDLEQALINALTEVLLAQLGVTE